MDPGSNIPSSANLPMPHYAIEPLTGRWVSGGGEGGRCEEREPSRCLFHCPEGSGLAEGGLVSLVGTFLPRSSPIKPRAHLFRLEFLYPLEVLCSDFLEYSIDFIVFSTVLVGIVGCSDT